MTHAFIYDAIRTPRGRGKATGQLHEVPALRLSAQIINDLLHRNNLPNNAPIEDVIWGNVTQIGEQGGCLARSLVLYSNLDQAIPGLSINRFCASGLESVNLAANQINARAGAAYIAGGVESMSRVPMGSDGAAIAADPYLAMKSHFVPQGISADIIATEYGFSRADCDTYAAQSHARATFATQNGFFDKNRVAVKDQNGLIILAEDEQIRPDTTPDSLAALSPSFKDIGEGMPGFDKIALMKYPHLERIDHVHHAGNSSAISDGAAGVLLGSRQFGKDHGLKPRARIVATAKIGTDPTIMLTGPIPVCEKILKTAKMTLNDIDLFEVNEAFAAVVLRFMQHFNLNDDRLNVNGGAIAMGHPLGATGAMILGTLLDEMERRDVSIGLVAMCIGSGMGVATIIERV